MTPEQEPRSEIDRLLTAAGWSVQRDQANIAAAQGVGQAGGACLIQAPETTRKRVPAGRTEESLPGLPPEGIKLLADSSVVTGSRFVGRTELVPGRDPPILLT